MNVHVEYHLYDQLIKHYWVCSRSVGRVKITYNIEPIGKRYRNVIHCIPKYTLVWLSKENQFRIFPWPFSFIHTQIDERILWFYLLIRVLKIWIRRRSNRQQITLKVVFFIYFFFKCVNIDWIVIDLVRTILESNWQKISIQPKK